MMANLRLTVAESAAVVIDDVDDLKLVDPDRAIVGKVLNPNVLHINTISAALRPAWGNPKGLLFNPAGDNLFVAEFGSKADCDRVMDGSPWVVGRHAVLMKNYDVDVHPQQVVFDRLAIWARILALPNRLMNADRGTVIAATIGLVKKVEADALGRCWGGYMRLRVEVKVKEPLMRAVTVFSSRLQTTESYAVQYEHLPIYCFSCGLIGHSKLTCANPADRDENGDLPYCAKRLSVDDNMKRAGTSKSRTNAASSEHSGTAAYGAHQGRGKSAPPGFGPSADGDVSSPQMGGAFRGRGYSGRGRGRGSAVDTARDLTVAKELKSSAAGKKRKSAKMQHPPILMIEAAPVVSGNQAQVVADSGAVERADNDVHSSDSNKKQRTTPSRSADLAATAEQSRPTQ
jgi:hypothetical protein